jgi:tetratricopeptide (TPR) repeat protein
MHGGKAGQTQGALFNNLGQALRASGRLAESIEACKKAVAAMPSSASYWVGLAKSSEAGDSAQAAVGAYQNAIVIAP